MLPDEPIREHPELPGDPYMCTDGGGGKRHRCKKPNNSFLIPNIPKAVHPPAPGEDPPAHPSSPSASILKPPPPNSEYLPHDGVGSVADGVGRVGGGDPLMGMDSGGDPLMGADGDGRRQQCKNLVAAARNRRDIGSVVPNSTKNGTDGVGRVGGQEIDGGEPQMRTDNGGDPHMRTVAAGRKRKNTDRNQPNDTFVSREKYQKVKTASPRLRSPFQVTSSPGVNLMVRSSLKREAVKRENMAGSPKTPQPANCTLEDLSPDTIAANSHASKRKRRKLISDIWREAEPIYKEGKLVEGKCIHCHQIFAASRDTGTSHMKRHLKVCEAKIAMNDMVAKMGPPGGANPSWKFNAKLARRKLLKKEVGKKEVAQEGSRR